MIRRTAAGRSARHAACVFLLVVAGGCGDSFSGGTGGDGATAPTSSSTSSTSTASGSGGTTSPTTTDQGGSGHGGAGQGGGAVGGEGGSGGEPVALPCDASASEGWNFSAAPIYAGTPFDVTYWTSNGGWTNVKFVALGPGTPWVLTSGGNDVDVIGGQPGYEGLFAWRSTVHDQAPGVLQLDFGRDCLPACEIVSSCSVQVLPPE